MINIYKKYIDIGQISYTFCKHPTQTHIYICANVASVVGYANECGSVRKRYWMGVCACAVCVCVCMCSVCVCAVCVCVCRGGDQRFGAGAKTQ